MGLNEEKIVIYNPGINKNNPGFFGGNNNGRKKEISHNSFRSLGSFRINWPRLTKKN